MYGINLITDTEYIHTFHDLGLNCISYNREPPTPQTVKISVPGRNGEVDITERVYGYIPYYNTVMTLMFEKIVDFDDYELEKSNILNSLHGKQIRCVLDNSQDYYYLGTCSISISHDGITMMSVEIYIDTEPYAYNQQETLIELTLGENIIYNSFMRTIPRFIVESAEATIRLDGYLVTFQQGERIIEDLVLSQGNNLITLESGSVTIKYQEGEL